MYYVSLQCFKISDGFVANNFTEDVLFLLLSNSLINVTENVKRS